MHAWAHALAGGIPTALTAPATIAARRGMHPQMRIAIIVTLRRLEGCRVAERILPGVDERQRISVMIHPPSRRNRRIGGGGRHLWRSKERQFLRTKDVGQQLQSSLARQPGSLLTELSNLARLRRPPSTIFSTLISVLPNCSLALPDEEPGAPSPLL